MQLLQRPWIKAGAPIFNTEYFTTRCMNCTQANLMDLSTIKKVPDLTSCRVGHSVLNPRLAQEVICPYTNVVQR